MNATNGRQWWILTLALLVMAAGCAPAAFADPAAGGPAPYLLAAGDSIGISVINFPELSTQVVVPPDGNISLPLLPAISVTGRTTGDIARLLAAEWRRYVINPSVNVTLTAKRPQTVLVYGMVSKAGPLDYRNNLRILDVLAEVGGAAPTADLSRVTVTHRDGGVETIDLSAADTAGSSAAEYTLRDGDVVYLPERKRTEFSVLGEVNRPGNFGFEKGATLLDAITGAAGGVKESANLSQATLLHDGKIIPVDLQALLAGDPSKNMALAPGDVLSVPKLPHNQFTVLGEVARPGTYDVQDDTTVLSALNAAGGMRDDADFSAATLSRSGKEMPVDLDALLRHGDMSVNRKLQPGDRLMIPIIHDRIYVFGAVARPGFYPFKAGERLFDVLNDSGGAQRGSNLGDVHIIQVDKAKNTATVERTDLQKFLDGKDKDGKGNATLVAGECVFVPDKTQHTPIMQSIIGVLSGMGMVGSAVRLVSGL